MGSACASDLSTNNVNRTVFAVTTSSQLVSSPMVQHNSHQLFMSRQWHQYAIALLGFVVVLALVQHSEEQIDFITVTLSLCVIILYESNTHWDSSVAQKLVLLLNLEVEDLVSFAGVRAS